MNTVAPIFNDMPYIFLSYAHKNPQFPLKIIEILQEEGFRVWYDTGELEPGKRYNEIIDVRIKNCAVFVPVLSMEYCDSPYCSMEIMYAKEQYAKPIVPIFLEKPDVLKEYYRPGMGLFLSGIDGFIIDSKEDLSVFRKKIHESEYLLPCNKAADKNLTQGTGKSERESNNRISAYSQKTFVRYASFGDYLKDDGENGVRAKKNSAIIGSLLSVVQKNIQEENFEEADEHLRNILLEDPENADAIFYRLLVKYRVKSVDDLASLPSPVESVDIRAAVIYQNEERKKLLLNALDQNRKYQQYIIASSHMAADRYEAALNILEKIKDFRDSDQLLQKCRNRIDYCALVLEYENKIGDGTQYLSEKFREKSSEDYEIFAKLCRETSGDHDNTSIFFYIIAVLSAAEGAGLVAMPASVIFIYAAAILAVVLGLLIVIGGSKVGGICTLVIAGLLLYFSKSAYGIIFVVLALISLYFGVYSSKKHRKYKTTMAIKETFFTTHIKDFEEEQRRKIESEYADILPENRKELLSVEEGIRKAEHI